MLHDIIRENIPTGVIVTMLQKDILLKKLIDKQLHYYETVSDVSEDASIQLSGLDSLFTFMNQHSIDTVFFHFDYAAAEDLQITDPVLDTLNIDDDIRSVMKTTFQKYNDRIAQLDFSRPYALTVYCIYQGFIVYCDDYDYWFRDLGYSIPKKAALELIEEKLDAIESKMEEAAQERERKRDQLRQRILSDKNFHKCTNKELRRAYTQKLWNSDESIHALFYSPKLGLYDIRIDAFIDEVWKAYKASL